MIKFVQVHALTVYPLSNPNRDDTGRPKTAEYGGAPRLRLSSQSIKRAIRTSNVFQTRLEGSLGERTQRIGEEVDHALMEVEPDEKKRRDIVAEVIDVFGKIDDKRLKGDKTRPPAVLTRQLAFISPDERDKAIELALAAARGEPMPKDKELSKAVLRTADGAVDIAMFGRMLADDPDYNREAAVQVAHAFTTHRALVEDDFYTAVDDRKTDAEDAGAGFVGEAGFGSGVFYLYACIDQDLLLENLDGNEALAGKAIEAFVEAVTRSTPSGKRAAFAHQTVASHLLVEKGSQQPRSLAGAFFKPVKGEDLLERSAELLVDHRDRLDGIYGSAADETATMSIVPKLGDLSLAEIVSFAARR